ncbi:MAG: hypothetical protein M0P72_09755 [Metallibacterium scheffleri]|uniref:hypothetical protein n=1 Tax=Metallibacterium scheffleri TaxID=993689 RepID=UPI0026EEDC88|nr:hypothetical protein [Metallibacterium scheffleri]MCK9367415.1 hypothetical protein [Metallibacterium scheffleri]
MNTYYKLVLDRRIEAYGDVERLINMINTAVIGHDQRPYHLLFSKDDDHAAVYKMLGDVMSQALWLSDDLFQNIRELNVLIYSKAGDSAGLVEFGKNNYIAIGKLRTQIKSLHGRDMRTLHKVSSFFKRKKHLNKYESLPNRD